MPRIVADADLNSLPEELSEGVASEARLRVLHVIVAGFDLRGQLAGERDLVSWFDSLLTFLALDLLENAGVLRRDVLVVDRGLSF